MHSARQHAGVALSARASLHVDGSARVQVIDEESDDFLRGLLERATADNVEAILNTSFNTRGEPLVETPREALATFASSDIDAMLLEQSLLVK